MKVIIQKLLVLLTLVLLGAGGYFVITTWQEKIRHDAIQTCFSTGEVTFQTQDGATIRQPSKEWYEQCLKDKGLK